MREVTHPGYPLGLPIRRKAFEVLDAAAVLTRPGSAKRNLALRLLAERAQRLLPPIDGAPLRPGELITLAVLHDVFRFIVRRYCREDVPGVLARGRGFADHGRAAPVSAPCLATFPRTHPTATPALADDDAMEELLLLELAVGNPAAEPCRVLFGDEELRAQGPLASFLESLERFFDRQPPVRGRTVTLLHFLREPILAHPHSLSGQLAYILERWVDLLPDWLRDLLLTTQGILREEQAMRGAGPGSPQPEVFEGRRDEPERFTPDRDWMANVVLLAKSTRVWLDQLSRKYRRSICRLDEVPSEELDRIGRWGFTGLWLIGLWERSPASEEIKRRMGNPDAVASAYSLYDYVIAADLGGEAAFADLARRASERGIRLAADMVPNHVGIYSKWVVENPDRFLQLDHPPFPGYRFTGPDLSRTPGVGIRIEDGYWNRSDAAVVFERVDHDTGRRRYIYHGNDGTSMPWNDTAQLDYLNPEVRETVIQTILHVARRFSIIRFDAAMTLASRHIQRLWHPAPGDGGAIPSRAEHGLSRDRFAELMPREFWREVVDRIQAELPDTLLLAEAFWLLEGYFVRTLGMHRVYNSAFMNMMKMEHNDRYRQTIKNVLEYSPQVLKRFVNFMSNPDERTAIEQFGKDDKYFGNAIVMVTLPGLPMFAHGQIEGYTERYGMEYPRAYWDEWPDDALVARHEREVFPLMRRRHLFSQVEHFALYDFENEDGAVDEDVFAYSNAAFGERAVIVYHNAYRHTRGRVRISSAINAGSAEAPALVRRSLGEALGLNGDGRTWYRIREHLSGLEYLRNGRELCAGGLYVELGAYGAQVFLDWSEAVDADGSWARLAGKLGGAGVPDLAVAKRELDLEPITEAFSAFARAAHAGAAAEPLLRTLCERVGIAKPERVIASYAAVAAALEKFSGPEPRRVTARLVSVCARELLPLAPILAVLRALPLKTVEDGWLFRTTARVLGRPELADLLPRLIPARTDRRLIESARDYLLVNRHQDVEWFNRERMELLVKGQGLSRVVTLLAAADLDPKRIGAAARDQALLEAAVAAAEHRLARLLDQLPTPKPAPRLPEPARRGGPRR